MVVGGDVVVQLGTVADAVAGGAVGAEVALGMCSGVGPLGGWLLVALGHLTVCNLGLK